MSASLAVGVLSALFATAAPPSAADVPEPLRPWVGWALHGRERSTCTFLDEPVGASDVPSRRCAWPSRLSVAADDKGARFVQSWHVEVAETVPLPGGPRRWPVAVKVDGAPAAMIPEGAAGNPGVLLAAGDHQVAGEFAWDALPESLPVPVETGLVSLTLRGAAVPLPTRDSDGTLWLQRRTETEAVTEGDRLEVGVNRLVADEVPVRLVTRIDLRVSGKSREVLFGRALPAGFVAAVLDSPLPARLESDSRLRVQIRPGTYTLTLEARSEGPVSRLARPDPDGTWSDDGGELWVFDARPELREVALEGVELIDPNQTDLPADWKKLPSFPMAVGGALALVEHRRGDSAPPADQLALRRELWLDFDGGGYTVRDTVTGTAPRSWRLEMSPPGALGRTSVNGEDLLITRLGAGNPGVELRQERVDLSADSRLEGNIEDLPAVGWDASFSSVSSVIHLPPGWRLLHATGVDEASPTWLGSYSWPDLLLVAAVALAAWRLLGLLWGLLALLALALTVAEPGAPAFSWLLVLAVEGLGRVLPEGFWRRAARAARLVLLFALSLSTALFVAGQLQFGLYPTVVKEASESIGKAYSGIVWPLTAFGCALAAVVWLVRQPSFAGKRSEAATAGVLLTLIAMAAIGVITLFGQNLRALFSASANALGGEESGASVGGSSGEGFKARRKAIKSFGANSAGADEAVQTGPGIPTWERYNTTERLSWRGPIPASQRVRLYLVGPTTTLALCFVRSLLVALLLFALLRFPGPFWPRRLRLAVPPALPLALLAALAAALLAPATASAQVPSPELLDELGERLTQAPECAPRCASNPRLLLEVGADAFTLRLEVSAAAATAVPLPGAAPDLVPSEVQLDGRPAPALARDATGRLWLAVPAGLHQVVVSGRMPARDTVPLALPLRARRVEAKVSGWRLDGLHEDGAADDTLLLTRTGANPALVPTPGAPPAPAPTSASLASFVRVERTLVLGLRWEAKTKVVRTSPKGTPLVLEVALLPGESVTTAGVRVLGGKAQVALGPGDEALAWDSVVEEKPTLKLVAPKVAAMTELWRLEASPLWHVSLGGIPPARSFGEDGARRPEWQPWPGEEVVLAVARPPAVPGQVLTIDHSKLELTPGERFTVASLEVSLRSSRSGTHALTLPEGAVLSEVAIDGTRIAARQEGRKVVIPVGRGAQTAKLTWGLPDPLPAFFRAPEVGLGTPGVNADTELRVPSDRIVVALGGSRLGPSAQLWAVLAALCLVALLLGRLRTTPLREWHWAALFAGGLMLPWHVFLSLSVSLLLLGWRSSRPELPKAASFNLRQAGILAACGTALVMLAVSVAVDLQGRPDFLIAGNGSVSNLLHWTEDRTSGLMPRPWVLSIPVWGWRAGMVAWLAWLALMLFGWGKWGFKVFKEGGMWRKEPDASGEPGAGAR